MKVTGLVTKKLGSFYLVEAPQVRRFLVKGQWEVGEKVEVDAELLRKDDKFAVLTVKNVCRGEGEPGVDLIRKSTNNIGKKEVLTGTLCSQSKHNIEKATPEFLWDSYRIKMYLRFCDQYGLPASIISWKYGVVPREVEVFNYDEFETRDVAHWVKVLSEARDRYGIKELYIWPGYYNTLSVTLLRAARKVFDKSGATRHLYNLNRFLYRKGSFKDMISSWIPSRSRVVMICVDDISLLHYLTNVKHCKCIMYDNRPWAKEIQKAIVKRERLPKKLPDNIDDLLQHNNLTVRAAAIVYLMKRGTQIDLTELREIGKTLLEAGRYRRVELRHVFPRIERNDIVLVKEPVSYPRLKAFFEEPGTKFDWDETLFSLGRRVPSSVLIIREGKLQEVNRFVKIPKKYFSDWSVLTFNDIVVYKCS